MHLRNTILFRFGLGFAFWVAGLLPIGAGNWPGFRGPTGDGVAAGENPVTYFGPGSNVLWQVEVLRAHSCPVLWGHSIFLTGAGDRTVTTVCLDRASGRKRWERQEALEKMEPVHQVNSRATPTPVTDGQAVYAYFGSFGLLAYDFEGKEKWRKSMPIPQTFFNEGTATSPILAQGKLLVFFQHGQESHLLAVNPADGRELWKAPMPVYNLSWATPVTWEESGQGRVGLTCGRRFTAFDLAEGKAAWWVDGLGFQAAATPVLVGDRLILTTAGAQGEEANSTPPPAFDDALTRFGRAGDESIAYDAIPADLLFTDRHASDRQGDMTLRQALALFGGIKKGDKLDRGRWEELRGTLTEFAKGPANQTVVLCVRTGGRADVTASQVVWRETKGVPETPSPLAWQGRLYLVRSGGLLVCRELASGKLIYERRLEAPGAYFASPVIADGRIYLVSDRGTVVVVKAGDAFEVLARNELKEPVLASPAIVGNTLYVRSTRHLWAFGRTRAD